ncbi:28S ribosomal protein S29, mitochondrial [Manacus vitellinus]|uniref:28S ribosomal protein S29, mitochondrial n=1 Tax=Manacus vitellinus TaxID=328815 RepID=UPI00115CC291|nr:28S ribosomal protein S29, mitochondrial [Manacus vitellinus]
MAPPVPQLEQGCGLPTAAKECLSSVASQDVPTPQRPRAVFHTRESDPAKHTEQHEGRHYNIPLEEVKAVFPHGLPYRFQQQVLQLGAALEGGTQRILPGKNLPEGQEDPPGLMGGRRGEFLCQAEAAGRKENPKADVSNVPQVSPEELTLVHNLRKMVMNDWVSSRLGLWGVTLSHEGFDALDPFVPILVPNYSPREFESCYGYYLERRWLQHEQARTEDGKAELQFLSGSNPRQLDRLAGPL